MISRTRHDVLKEAPAKAIQDVLEKKLLAVLDNCSVEELEEELKNREAKKDSKEAGLKEMGQEPQSRKGK